ncbi:MAG: LytTR family transcriptional regulator DNA-binding domain-containing protein [Tissierellia bacterium]|nr:LytTR family transcriptional regulator DNA-binding domain-containing protein [Tissierellia bacterium]MDD4780301.1 LytTR family transcriptional regulator DNA-binding domain-containing protein [Tissierellia bacterium]
MHIIICEDNIGMKKRLHSIVQSCIISVKEDVNFIIKCFDSSCEELNQIINSKEDKIYILDVELKGNENGTFIAQKIRMKDRTSKIIFITSYDDELHNILYKHIEVMDFISKNDDFVDRVKRAVMNSISILLKPEYKRKIIVKDGDYTSPVFIDDIIYASNITDTKYIEIHTLNDGIKLYKSSLKGIMNELDERFVKIKSNIILNTDYISIAKLNDSTNKEIILTTGEILTEISRSGKKELRKLGY